MNVPTGYTELDLVGFTDKGAYNASSEYVKNDLVHYNDGVFRCLKDEVTGVTPAEGDTWTVWVAPASGVSSFNGRTGAILPVLGDYADNKIELSTSMSIGGGTQTKVNEALQALDEYSHKTVVRTGVTAALAGTSIRIPESGTNSNIKTTSLVIPIGDNGTAVPIKYTSCTVSAGYVTIVFAEALSDATVGIEIFN